MMDGVPQLETCRICAKCYLSSSPADFLHLFQPQEGKQCELDFIRKEIKCWQLKISPNDGLPQQICSNCFQKFCSIKSFRQDCVAAQDLLHKAFQVPEPQAQNIVTTQVQQQQTTILLPPGFVVATPQPISQQLNSITSQIVSENPKILQDNNISLPQQVETAQIPVDNIIFNVINENAVVANDSATSNPSQYEQNSETSWDETKFFNEVIAQEADTTTQSSTEDFPKRNNNSNDFEEVLEGSIIPKDLKNLLKKNGVLNEAEDLQLEENSCTDDAAEEKGAQRLANYAHACNYCYCPAKGAITHLVFESSEELSQHFFDIHDPKLPYPCPKCPKLFATMANRNKHYDLFHCKISAGSKHCTYCNKKLSQVSQENHEKSCNFIADWHCETCENDFIKVPLHSFRAHQRSHAQRRFRCDTCSLVFSQLSLMLIHKQSHQSPKSPINKEDYKCAACNLDFNSMYELKSHEFATHDGLVAFRCNYCAKGYSTLAFLERHMKDAHSDQTRRFGQNETTCPKCNATFQSKIKLHNHMQRTKYENGRCTLIKLSPKAKSKSFMCQQCSKHFNFKEQLELHLKSHDNLQRPFACNKCNIHFRSPSDLKEHDKLAHIKLSAFECELCGAKFAYNKDLETHKLYHAKLSFQCTFKDCKTSCRDEKTLEHHMRTHESVSCEYCGELFETNYIEAHIKSMHNNNNSNLENGNYQSVLTKPTSDFSFNQNHIFENFTDPMEDVMQTSSLTLNQNSDNICAPYVEPMECNLLDNVIIFEEQELLTEANNEIADNVDFIMSGENLVNDSFIKSLLDPEYEIGVN